MGYVGCRPGWKPDQVLIEKEGISAEQQIAEERATWALHPANPEAQIEPLDEDEPRPVE